MHKSTDIVQGTLTIRYIVETGLESYIEGQFKEILVNYSQIINQSLYLKMGWILYQNSIVYGETFNTLHFLFKFVFLTFQRKNLKKAFLFLKLRITSSPHFKKP
jgi:hypothetical protein